MIRHSSSFLVSVFIHVLIAFALFISYTNFPTIEKKRDKVQKLEKKVCVALCKIHKEHTPVVKKPKPIEKIKPPVHKPKPKPKPIVKKPKPKPKVIKKAIHKKVIPKKIVHVKKEEVKPKEEVIVSVKQEIKESVTEKIVPKETQENKEQRLENDYFKQHLQEVAQLLQENLYYPRSARRRAIVGKVIVKFTLSTDGVAHSISITSSVSEVLSRAAITTIENLSGDFPKPQEELILHVPINYKLK